MQIKSFEGDLYEENTYVIYDDLGEKCVVIDPGCSLSDLAESYEIYAILLTHAHIDHMLYAQELSKQSGAPIYIHREDKEIYEDDELCLWNIPKQRDSDAKVVFFSNENLFEVDGFSISYIHTPGHTPGSVCYIAGSAMFSGDTIMKDSIGRFDLPLGNLTQMRETCEKLAGVEENYIMYPGHGPVTSLRAEQESNLYLRVFV